MIITNLTDVDYWFGPMHLLPGHGQTLNLDDTSDTSLYLLNDEVADAVNTLYLSSNITVSSAASPFPRPTGTPSLLHGDGSPQGMVYAPQGSLYMRRDSVHASTGLYTKTTGVTQNTGWISVIAPAMEFIEEITLGTAASSITFESIPQSYSHLKIVASLLAPYGTPDPTELYLSVNGYSSDNDFYLYQATHSAGSSVSGVSWVGAPAAQVGYVSYDVFGATEITLTGYTSESYVPFVVNNTAIDANYLNAWSGGGLIITSSTGLITSVSISVGSGSQLDENCVATLYGLTGNVT